MVVLTGTGVVLASSTEPVGAASKSVARASTVWVDVGAAPTSERSHDVVALDAIHRWHDAWQHCGVTSELSGGLCFIKTSLV